MKGHYFFKSLYVKFSLIFIAIWWILNFLTFSIILKIVWTTFLSKMEPVFQRSPNHFEHMRTLIGLVFLGSALLGTIAILLVVRGIVKPIKKLSKASKDVAAGNFDIAVKVKSKDEVGRLTADFNKMVSELKSIDTLRKDFVSNVSHEFKTPITAIKGFATLLRDGQISEDQQKEYSSIIVHESERLISLSGNLLRLSELDSQVIREKAVRFSLDEQLRKSILMLEPMWSKKEIEFDISLTPVDYVGEEDLLMQVWLNLIGNAVKFSPEGGVIKISLTVENGRLAVSISDNGMGIAEEDRQRIFERFFKGDKSRSSDGNGLGLVIAQKITELMQGTISVESQWGKGTTFRVELKMKN
ncbi:sensor histidine kinase [Gorillibacterium massiliense]|uniref:sensor histidine kinase n=1 Tax=Gorillibacterium massiliense TaxID=1280390 RepID=UPI0004B8F074|nr:HAMP domain-containing sensor histidine kinase [Gorillibacterium massiliense]